jgi:glycine C-acetyltransferase
MISHEFRERLRQQLDQARAAGTFKVERVLTTPQGAHINAPRVLNLCANNYLGLANDPGVVAAAHAALDRWGYGLSSVRFICGTQSIHKELERKLSEFLGTDDAILYSSCFDANGGLFETLLGEEDAVISDELNHASIIDGIRLCKAQRYRYRNNDMADLEAKLREATGQKLIATDGVFSMDGIIAALPAICDLAEKYDALVMVDDSHAVGVLGEHGRGTPEYHRVMGRVDILTGTLGKALGGASGGYTSGRAEIIELLRQRSRPYLFSNSVAPVIVATSLVALDRIGEARERLIDNTRYFRGKMGIAGDHPIVPVMVGDAARAVEMANRLLEKGVHVIAFSYPVVPKDKARIRVQISAAHTRDDLDFAAVKFAEVRAEMGI